MKSLLMSLEKQERDQLLRMINKGYASAIFNRAHILLKRDEGKSQEEISQLLYLDVKEIERTCYLYKLKGLEEAIYQPNQDIVELRQAAYQHDWRACEQISKRLFPLLKPNDVVYLLSFQLQIFRPLFELSHPDVRWPRDFLAQFLKNQPKVRVYTFPFLRETYSSPGSNGFLEAMSFLANIDYSQSKPDKHTFALAAEGIAKVIESRWLYYWATEHPNEWDEWVSTNKRPSFLESATADEAAANSWLFVAREVEKRLQSKAL